MNELEKAALQALEALESWVPVTCEREITALRRALEQQCVCGEPSTPGTHRTDGPCYAEQPAQQQEPVATVTSESGSPNVSMSWWHEPALPVGTKLYTSPPASKPWVGLTDEQITVLNFMLGADDMDGVWFGEQHPKEKGAFWWRNRLRHAFQDAAIEAKLKEKNT